MIHVALCSTDKIFGESNACYLDHLPVVKESQLNISVLLLKLLKERIMALV